MPFTQELELYIGVNTLNMSHKISDPEPNQYRSAAETMKGVVKGELFRNPCSTIYSQSCLALFLDASFYVLFDDFLF